ncbi:MAG TPA: hypothetical protein VFB82_08230, partial [Blastocatellia bacterium]|nr:hypothetical protein [Blastocatellia bacterium]
AFIDSKGNRSSAATADFSTADPGGPAVNNASYTGSKLTIKGASLGGQLQIEINGKVVAAGFSAGERKLKIKGNPSSLNLHQGSNRLRVVNGSLRSNLFVLDF